jgi:hypothetical protein
MCRAKPRIIVIQRRWGSTRVGCINEGWLAGNTSSFKAQGCLAMIPGLSSGWLLGCWCATERGLGDALLWKKESGGAAQPRASELAQREPLSAFPCPTVCGTGSQACRLTGGHAKLSRLNSLMRHSSSRLGRFCFDATCNIQVCFHLCKPKREADSRCFVVDGTYQVVFLISLTLFPFLRVPVSSEAMLWLGS